MTVPYRDPPTLTMLREAYTLLLKLPKRNHKTPPKNLPLDGVYAFFERGEKCRINGRKVKRIVRVGINEQDGNFRKRIRQHYGNVNSLMGHTTGSVFRNLVGGALLRKAKDRRWKRWVDKIGSFPDVEKKVSAQLRRNFTFVCFRLNTQTGRHRVEKGLIGLLACCSPHAPSKRWLGYHAADERVQESCLWNRNYTKPKAIDLSWFDQFKRAVQSQLRRHRH